MNDRIIIEWNEWSGQWEWNAGGWSGSTNTLVNAFEAAKTAFLAPLCDCNVCRMVTA